MTQSGSRRLDGVLAEKLARRKVENRLRRLSIVPEGMSDFSSNGYLSISANPAVQQAFLSRLQSHVGPVSSPRPTSATLRAQFLGSGGSRLLDGNSQLAEALEREIAAFHRAPAGLLFNSGFDANTGLFGCVPQPGDVIVYDELIHASVHDGMRQSKAKLRLPFKHSCVFNDSNGIPGSGRVTKALDEVLKELTDGEAGRPLRDGDANIFIAVEGVYSMDGDVAPLKAIVECVERRLPRRNGYIIVDEAHSTGIFGDRGRGLVCELGLEDRVWARLNTFGKAMGCAGAIVLCTPPAREYLINYARSLIYTTAMSHTSLLAIQASYEFLMSGRADTSREHLSTLTHRVHTRLSSICQRYNPPNELFNIGADVPKSPIIPVFTTLPRDLARHCQEKGCMVRPIVAPTVPSGSERIRICMHSNNTIKEVDRLCAALEEWLALEVGKRPGRDEKVVKDIERNLDAVKVLPARQSHRHIRMEML